MTEGGFDVNDRLPSENNESLPVRTEDSITPVTIKQLLDSNYEVGKPLLIDGVQRKQISIVGVIEGVTDEELSMCYDINDSTGVFRVQDFTKEMELSDSLSVGTYVSVVGKIALSDDSRPIISAFSVRPVTDFNQIPYHHLQVLFVHLLTLRGLPAASAYTVHAGRAPAAAPSAGAAAEDASDEALHDKILDYLRTHNSIDGTPKAEIAAHLGSAYSLDRITKQLSAMEYNGEVYTPGTDSYTIC